jgi:drug/metabolite transporter (DMT)-like permease
VATPGVELETVPPGASWRSGVRARSGTGVVLCLISAVSFGLAAVCAKEAFRAGVSLSSLLVGRFAIAAVVFWVIVARRRPGWPSRRALLIAVGLGSVGYALQSACYFGALTRLDASVVAQLLYVYPALVVIIAVLRRRERADRRTLVALGCSAVGLLLLLHSGGGGQMAMAGVVMALGAAGTYALYITVAAGLPEDVDVYLLSAVVCTSAAISLTGYGLSTGTLHTPEAARGWLWLLMLALVPTTVAIVTFLAGLRLVGPAVAAILSCVEPVVTAASAVLVYSEELTPWRIIGGAAVLSSVLVLRARREPSRDHSGGFR